MRAMRVMRAMSSSPPRSRNASRASCWTSRLGSLKAMSLRTVLTLAAVHLPLLEEIIFNDENMEVQMAALDRLKDAPEDEMAVTALQKIAEEHPNQKIRNLAREAVTIDAFRRTRRNIKNMQRDQ